MVRDRVREVAIAWGAGPVAVALLLVLVDLTGQGVHASWASRVTLGRELAKATNWRRPLCSVATVGRALRELTRLRLIRTRRRWDAQGWDRLPAFRYLTDELMAAVGELARQRSKRRRRREPEESRPQPAPVTPDATPLDVTGGAAGVAAVRAKLRGPPAD